MIKKPAFMSITAIAIAFYVLNDTKRISRQTFRGLVLLLAVSWIYDAIWLLLLEPSSYDEDMEDGGNEWKLRRFIKLMSFITFFFKLIVVLVFWKVSLDFRAIVRNQGGNKEENIELIIAQY